MGIINSSRIILISLKPSNITLSARRRHLRVHGLAQHGALRALGGCGRVVPLRALPPR